MVKALQKEQRIETLIKYPNVMKNKAGSEKKNWKHEIVELRTENWELRTENRGNRKSTRLRAELFDGWCSLSEKRWHAIDSSQTYLHHLQHIGLQVDI